MRTIGIMALQGAFEEHEASFASLPENLSARFRLLRVRRAEQLDECDALVLPGGETTAMKIIGNDNSDDFMASLRAFVHGGVDASGRARERRPVWGTCAGCILLSAEVCNSSKDSKEADVAEPAEKRCKYGDQVGGLEIATCRNFFGRQADSFETETFLDNASALSPEAHAAFDKYPAVFIRAPAILRILPGATALARIRHREVSSADGVVVAAESAHALATCFHPELSQDNRIHRYFVERFVLKTGPATV